MIKICKVSKAFFKWSFLPFLTALNIFHCSGWASQSFTKAFGRSGREFSRFWHRFPITRHQTESGNDRGEVWTGRGKARRRSDRSRKSGGEELTFLWVGGDTRRSRVMTLIFCWESSKSRKMLKANNALFVLACSLVSGTAKYLFLVNFLNLQTTFWLIFRGWFFQSWNYWQIWLWFDLNF